MKSSKHKTTPASSQHICKRRHGRKKPMPLFVELAKLQQNKQLLLCNEFYFKIPFQWFWGGFFLTALELFFLNNLLMTSLFPDHKCLRGGKASPGKSRLVSAQLQGHPPVQQQRWHFVWASQIPFSLLRRSQSLRSVRCHWKQFSELQRFAQPNFRIEGSNEEVHFKNSMSVIHFSMITCWVFLVCCVSPKRTGSKR